MTEIASGLASAFRNQSAQSFSVQNSAINTFAEARRFNGQAAPTSTETTGVNQNRADTTFPASLFGEQAPSLAQISSERFEFEARIGSQRSFDLQLVTQDGDVVSIEFDVASILALTEARSLTAFEARQAGSFFSGSETESRRSLNLSSIRTSDIKIIGDLDDEEFAALDALFADLGALSQSFFSEDFSRAQRLAENFQLDVSEFSSINFELGAQSSFQAIESYRSVQALEATNNTPERSSTFSGNPGASVRGNSLLGLLDNVGTRLEAFSQEQQVSFLEQSRQDLISLFILSVEAQLERQVSLVESVDRFENTNGQASESLEDTSEDPDLLTF